MPKFQLIAAHVHLDGRLPTLVYFSVSGARHSIPLSYRRMVLSALFPEVPTRVEIIDVSDYRPKKIPSPKWRECIKKVWEVDPLSCPKCGSEMKIISFINEADVIRKILEHLNLWEEKTPVERAPPDLIREKSCEPYDDGWPQYEEPSVTIH